jgi:hypothetical protein
MGHQFCFSSQVEILVCPLTLLLMGRSIKWKGYDGFALFLVFHLNLFKPQFLSSLFSSSEPVKEDIINFTTAAFRSSSLSELS